MTDIEKLKMQLETLTPYSYLMEKVNVGINRRAFFPGGKGTFNPN
jgi:hypothetical protein